MVVNERINLYLIVGWIFFKIDIGELEGWSWHVYVVCRSEVPARDWVTNHVCAGLLVAAILLTQWLA